jgi:FG-GAP repeat
MDEQSRAAAMPRRFGVRLLIAAAGGLLLLAAAVAANAPRAARPATVMRAEQASDDVGADFNGDGFADLAVGVPGESVTVGDRDINDAGAVHVIYGSRLGLNGDTPLDDEVWHQNRFSGFVATPEPGDSFGYALAAGDFNGDGFDDLAVGVPFEDVPYRSHQIADAGEVDLLRGSPTGLVATIEVLRQGVQPLGSAPQKGDSLGFSLAAGNLGRDPDSGPLDDLVIGVPYEDWPRRGSVSLSGRDCPCPVKDSGAVQIVSGGRSGRLLVGPSQYWTQDEGDPTPPLIVDRAEEGDRFGFSVLALNVGRGREDDLIVGVPYEDLPGAKDAGGVQVIYAGLVHPAFPVQPVVSGNQFWHQDIRNIPGKAEPGDHFGWALAGADFGLDQTGDLAIGVPDEDVGDHPSAGVVNVLYGSSTGLTSRAARVWHQGSPGVQGGPENFDRFGFALTAGEFGFGAPADLAVGVPEETREQFGEDAAAAGAVNILMGTAAGLSARNNLLESQDSSGFDGSIEGESETADWFGSSLTAGNFGLGLGIDLAIGVPGERKESLFSIEDKVGAVNVLYSDQNGLRASDDQFWWQANDSLHDKAEEADQFGRALVK